MSEDIMANENAVVSNEVENPQQKRGISKEEMKEFKNKKKLPAEGILARQERIRTNKARGHIKDIKDFLSSIPSNKTISYPLAQTLYKMHFLISKSYISPKQIEIMAWQEEDSYLQNLIAKWKLLKKKKTEIASSPTAQNLDKYKKIIDFEKELAELSIKASKLFS